MTEQVKALFEAARRLTELEREELAAMLLGSLPLDPPVDHELAELARSRWADHMASGEQADDAFTALDDVRDQIQRKRP